MALFLCILIILPVLTRVFCLCSFLCLLVGIRAPPAYSTIFCYFRRNPNHHYKFVLVLMIDCMV